jgi:hypothetical protein
MADPQHLQIIQQGVDAWNEWRKKNPALIPDLSSADLSNTNLSDIGRVKVVSDV